MNNDDAYTTPKIAYQNRGQQIFELEAKNKVLSESLRKMRAALQGLRPLPLVVDAVAEALILEADKALAFPDEPLR